jgi:hypothetical protein
MASPRMRVIRSSKSDLDRMNGRIDATVIAPITRNVTTTASENCRIERRKRPKWGVVSRFASSPPSHRGSGHPFEAANQGVLFLFVGIVGLRLLLLLGGLLGQLWGPFGCPTRPI